ncbi:hypothetical protein SLS56_003336 [Neofusicoccum ribis]|uniref:Zn(2)-C6 fungal-type domain-containing protein n=1 Tax=Neofusicoccum ribis TaxID=45134 RepID=A0ABR3T0I6_9PEZI
MAEPDSSAESRKRRRGQRSNRPCDPCRRRKTRCIVESGSSSGECTVCLYRQTKCTYEESPPERPLPRRPSSTATSTSTVDASTRHPPSGELAHLSPGSGEIPRSAPSLPTLTSVRTNEELPSDVLSSGEASAAALEAARERQRNGDLVSDAERAKGEKSLGLDPTRFAELYGLGSDMEPILMRHRPYDPVHHEFRLSTHAIRRVLEQDQGVEYPLCFHIVSDEKAAGYSAGHQEVDAIEACVKPYGERLIRLFWRVVQPSYPILYKKGFVEKYSKSYRLISAPLLGAVYLNAINWWHFDPLLSTHPPPELSTLRRLTLHAIQNSYHRPRLSSIESMLLLLQCKPEDPLNPDHTFGWGLCSQALAIGEACGLHLDASAWTIPDWERTLRKRLSWALYMQDKWTACAYGRPSHITDDEWGVKDLDRGDFADCESEPDDSTAQASLAGQEQFLQMVRLSKILDVILKKFYSVKGCVNQDTADLYTKAQPIIESLAEWYRSLPRSLYMDSLPPRQLCPNGYLHLAYFGVTTLLLRRLVRSTALAPLCLDISVLNAVRQYAYDTAQKATALVASLRPEHLDSFWYFVSPYLFSVIGSFTTLLLVTSLTPSERDHWRETLNSYIWTLRTMSKSNEPIRYAVNRLEGAILRGLEHALVIAVDGPPTEMVETPQQTFEAGVNGFGFGFTEASDWDYQGMHLGNFDYLSTNASAPPLQ